MFKKLSLAGAALAMGATAVVPTTPALAGDRYYEDRYESRYDDRYEDRRGYRGRTYDRGRYNYSCRSSGTTGAIIGAIAGGLLGREIVGRRGDRTAGTLVGAGAGALLGRGIEKSEARSRCR